MNTIIMLSFIIIIFVVTMNLAYQIYKMVEIDAESRGLKHPKLWGLFSLGGGNGGGGLIVYLLGRRKYKSSMSEDEVKSMQARKKKAAVSLMFIGICFVGMLAVGIFTFN